MGTSAPVTKEHDIPIEDPKKVEPKKIPMPVFPVPEKVPAVVGAPGPQETQRTA